eukprot:g770.t1
MLGGHRATGGRKGKKENHHCVYADQMLPCEESRDFVRRLKLKSQKEWTEWSKSGQRPCNVPSHPEKVYKGKGWVSYPDWMGYKAKRTRRGQMMSFISARDVVRKLKMTSTKEWQEWSKSGQRPSNVPSAPHQVYKGKGWVSWPDWMGYQYTEGDGGKKNRKTVLSFMAARDIVRKLKLKGHKEWKEWSKSGQRPSNVPGNPDVVYKGKGWISYPDWMGYQYTKGDENRTEMMSFEDARNTVRQLRITSKKEWKEWSKSGQRPSNVPSHPEKVYKGNGWVSWPDWMGYQYTKGDQNKKRKRKRAHQAAESSAATSSSSSSFSSSLPPLENCSICFEPLCPVTTEIGHLSCVHSFHVDCLNGHARASATASTTSRRGVLLNCPLCRKRTRWLPPPPES